MTHMSFLAPASSLPVPQLMVVKDMIRRLQELRHTEQVQRAYALNCGEGATVSYELQLRVLREFGLADGATELLQVSGGEGFSGAWVGRVTCRAWTNLWHVLRTVLNV